MCLRENLEKKRERICLEHSKMPNIYIYIYIFFFFFEGALGVFIDILRLFDFWRPLSGRRV